MCTRFFKGANLYVLITFVVCPQPVRPANPPLVAVRLMRSLRNVVWLIARLTEFAPLACTFQAMAACVFTRFFKRHPLWLAIARSYPVTKTNPSFILVGEMGR